MRSRWNRWQRRLVALSTGGMTLGILGGFEMVNFAQLFTQLLSQWLSLLVALLLGADPSTLVALH